MRPKRFLNFGMKRKIRFLTNGIEKLKTTLPLLAKNLISETLELLKPEELYRKEIRIEENNLVLRNRSFEVKGRLHIAAVGKSASFEVQALWNILSQTPFKEPRSISFTKKGNILAQAPFDQLEGDHPHITQNNLILSKTFINWLSEIPSEDSLIFLLSGGTSALLEVPKPSLNLEDLQSKYQAMLHAGVGINEMNERRRELSLIKGGGLLNFIGTKNILQLITCDIPNERLEDVGSGPLLKANDQEMLKKSFLMQSGRTILSKLVSKSGDGFVRLSGKVYDCSFEDLKVDLLKNLPLPGEMHISAGECPVKVTKLNGKGGRNTHFVLDFAKEVLQRGEGKDLHILSLATDGGDGETDCAGAYIRVSDLILDDAVKSIENFESYSYFKIHGGLVQTGRTQSNVMDLRFVWRD